MNDHDLGDALRATYAARSIPDPSPQLAGRILAIPATSPQRRGSLPRFHNGGTHMLFSATRIVAAIAVLAISGSILLVAAQPGDDTAGPPGAAGDPAMRAPSGVVGNVVGPSGADAGSDGDVVELGDQMFEITGASGIVEWDASDPRLDGSGTRVENGLQHFASHSGLWSGAWTIQNADGTWVGTGNHFSSADGGRDFIIFEGSGAYEGLTAYVTIGASLPAESAGVRPFEGVIFPGEPPAMPEPMALE